ncbi:MAG TPA: deoxyguanosinetriphosphate triphosphohydrolase [Cyclobacteriaceae bacterium]|nr:deoxyguanosinetriphosphate triphosphohydrolase [Cyclobacteriaceae bacterium]HPW62321.1 deoxyguanosinetriphosphate triphosphohydrolase [Cyclobacteriaceae bacterium]
MNWIQLLSSQRFNQKSDSTESTRSTFEQDYDRIVFSHPFRRLQDKTQVHPLPEHDFVHTRLTHSLEVSSVGRSLGRRVGEVLIQRHAELTTKFSSHDFGTVVASASLAHDLGNPPFGHSGEDGLSDFFLHHEGQKYKPHFTDAEWADLTHFEGNAQGFRILNKSQYQGLRLTVATLGAFTKYPCPALFTERNKSKKSQKKFGFFQTEQGLFNQTAEKLGLIKNAERVWARHPLAFLVEAADDICYNIIDLEDGCRLGLVPVNETIELLTGILRQDFNPDKAARIKSVDEKIGVLRAMAIGKLISDVVEVFLQHETEILSGQFDQALTDLGAYKNELKQIIDISIEKIYRARHVVEIESAGFEVLPGLLDEFIKAAEHLVKNNQARKYSNLARLLPQETASIILTNPDNTYLHFREVVDFVSGLTDRHALSLYRKIKGFEI